MPYHNLTDLVIWKEAREPTLHKHNIRAYAYAIYDNVAYVGVSR